MTAPTIDPGARGDEPIGLAAARAPVPEATTRFADLLAREVAPALPVDAAVVPERSGAAALPELGGADVPRQEAGAHARLFNEDGFFGRPGEIAPFEKTLAASVHVAPVAAETTAALDQVSHRGLSSAPFPARAGLSVPPLIASVAPVPVTTVSGPVPRPSPTPVGLAPAPFRPVEVARAGRLAAPARPAPTRPQPTTAAVVAVALHAAARGIEVAAQVAGLDERDRAALADEIAALLSAHGYAPAQVSVTAAPRAARQEHR